jgi:hypothetical protein
MISFALCGLFIWSLKEPAGPSGACALART